MISVLCNPQTMVVDTETSPRCSDGTKQCTADLQAHLGEVAVIELRHVELRLWQGLEQAKVAHRLCLKAGDWVVICLRIHLRQRQGRQPSGCAMSIQLDVFAQPQAVVVLLQAYEPGQPTFSAGSHLPSLTSP